MSLYEYPHRFRLYLAGHTQTSKDAFREVKDLCQKVLPGRHRIEIIDILRHPERAAKEGITMTPALVRIEPKPIKKIVATFGLAEELKQTLQLEMITD